MRQKITLLTKTMLLLCALVAGSGSTWGEDADVTYDFTGSDWTVSNGTLSNGTVSFTGEGGANFKMNSGYFMLGKSGAYINFPKYSSPVEKIVVTGRSGASASVGQNIYVGEEAVSTATTGATGSNTYEIGSNYQAAGTQYTLKVTSNHNTQITKIEIYYASGKTKIATIGTLDPAEVNVGDIDDFSLDITPAANTLVKGTDYVVVWESSDDAILEVADETYEAKAAGEVTVTVTVTPDDDNTYEEVSRQFTVTVVDPNAPGTKNNPYTVAQAITNTPSSGKVYIHGIVSSFYDTSIIGDTSHRYYISDDGSTTTQLLVYSGKGLDDVAFSSADDLLIGDEIVLYGELITYQNAPEVAKDNYIISLNRTEKEEPQLSFGLETEFTCDITKGFEAPELSYAEGFDGTVVYSSSDTGVATVDASTGAVTLVAVGTTTITASSAATTNFLPGSASYTLNVTENTGVDPISPASNSYYVKVTDTDDITDGQYLIVYEADAVAFDGSRDNSNSNKLDAASNTISVEIDNGVIAFTTATQSAEFTIDVSAGTLMSKSGYYIGVSSNSNGLKLSDEATTYTNSFSINESGEAVISSVFDKSTMTLRYNSDSNQKRFRYYSSGQKAIQLYKYVGGTASETETVTLSGFGYKTLVATKNFTVSDAKAYIVTAADETDGVTMTSIAVVPANEPVILQGEPNAEATLTFTADAASDASANLLAVSAAAINYDGSYVLAKKDDAVGFYKWAGGTLGAGRVYLPATNVTSGSGAREYLPFNFGDANSIADIEHSALTTDYSVYNLNGQRVISPNHGLYIVNGKKVVMK